MFYEFLIFPDVNFHSKHICSNEKKIKNFYLSELYS